MLPHPQKGSYVVKRPMIVPNRLTLSLLESNKYPHYNRVEERRSVQSLGNRIDCELKLQFHNKIHDTTHSRWRLVTATDQVQRIFRHLIE